MQSSAFIIFNAVGIAVNLTVFCFNLWIQSKLRSRYRLDEATDDYWFRTIFVNEMSGSIKAISEFHVSFWDSKAKSSPGNGISLGSYLQNSLQTDLNGFFRQAVIVCDEFEHLPNSLIEDIYSIIYEVDAFIADKCNEYETGNLAQDKKNRIKSEIISHLRLLPPRILAALMKAHKELVGGNRGRWGRWASAAYRKMCSTRSWRLRRPRYWFTSKR